MIVGNEETFPRRDKGKGGWCNGSKDGTASKGHGYYNVYIARTPRLAAAARDAEASGDDAAFARYLGTPECCRRFYERVKDEAARDQNDFFPFSTPTLPSESTSAWLNLGAQYFDAALISHFPCSLNCLRSIQLARARARLLFAHDPQWLRQTLHLLNHATLYTEYLGIYLLGRACRIGSRCIRYDRRAVHGTSASRLFAALAGGSDVALLPSGMLEIRSRTEKRIFRPRNVRLFLPSPVALDALDE